jgi:hypothetical protein
MHQLTESRDGVIWAQDAGHEGGYPATLGGYRGTSR